jgi:hypothetical protein
MLNDPFVKIVNQAHFISAFLFNWVPGSPASPSFPGERRATGWLGDYLVFYDVSSAFLIQRPAVFRTLGTATNDMLDHF